VAGAAIAVKGAAASVAGAGADHVLVAIVADPAVELTELSNGLRIVTEAMPEARSVAIGAWVGVGGRDEPAALAGASHFLEHLLFKGTEARTARHIAEAVDSVGGEINAFTSREHTAYYARLPHQHVGLGIEVLGDVLTAPAFRPHEVEAERQVIVEEILMNLDSPEDRVHTLLGEALFPGHPLGRDVLGEQATVEAITRDQIASFFDRWYRPGTMALVATGNLRHREVVELAERELGDRTGGSQPQRTPPERPPVPMVVEHDVTEQAHLCLGWRSISQHDDDRWALLVANQVLGGGSASRLFQEVREERGLAYSVYSYPSTYADTGSLSIYCGTAPKRVRDSLAVVDDVVVSLVEDGVTETELVVAKGYLEGSYVLALEDTGGRMGRIGRALVRPEELLPVEAHLARIRAVTADDVARVLRRTLAGPRTLAAVGPFDASFFT
jgi:predicted Zn-dependent peptidase